jgi:SpoVK/Ycf46/Vps4 family AAA+-type ATPase
LFAPKPRLTVGRTAKGEDKCPKCIRVPRHATCRADGRSASAEEKFRQPDQDEPTRKTAAVNPEKYALGWYLHNIMASDCRDALIGVVDRLVPCLQGGKIKPEQPWAPPGRKAERTAGSESASPEALSRLLADYATRPAAATDIVERNAIHAGTALGLDALEKDLLVLVVRTDARRQPMKTFFQLAWNQIEELPPLFAALLGVEAYEVESRLEKAARLVACGLITVDAEAAFSDFACAVTPLPLVARQMRKPFGTAETWVQALLGEQARTPLRWSDFAHVRVSADMAARLLRRAARGTEAGVHVLLVGPAGTGKTEFAKALATRARIDLFAVGETGGVDDDDRGDEPSRGERFGALRLASNLLSRARKSALLLDEAEDVLEAPRSFGNRRDSFSKVFLHRTLETLAVPVIWTCNDLSLMDPATLRRMTMVIELPVPDVATRTRIWQRVVARERLRLPADVPERLARDWEASAGVAAGAARAARLTDGDAQALEHALRGIMGAMGHYPAPRVPTIDFDLDLVDCAQSLPALCERLARPDTSRAWSLCLSGPPGTGKSEFARHLARRLDLPVLQKRASDLLSMFVGGSEKAIARAFREARDGGALLLIDEAEALLFDRSAATRSWEISQVNEMLTWMENHPLPFVCTTNLPERLDHAVPRRFVLKLHFGPLNQPRAALAFRRLLGSEPPGPLPDGLTPGDFAVVRGKAALFGERDPRALMDWLREEADAKTGGRAEIGFRGPRREPETVSAMRPFPRAA